MVNLSTEAGQQEIIGRIQKLSASSQPLWGKMNVGQMLAHVQGPLEVSIGKMQLKPMFIMKLLGGMIRKGLLNDKPVKRNNPTAPQLRITDARDFDMEKRKLLDILRAYAERSKAGSLEERHPYFGKLNTDEWGRMQGKHLDHHLKQFGV